MQCISFYKENWKFYSSKILIWKWIWNYACENTNHPDLIYIYIYIHICMHTGKIIHASCVKHFPTLRDCIAFTILIKHFFNIFCFTFQAFVVHIYTTIQKHFINLSRALHFFPYVRNGSSICYEKKYLSYKSVPYLKLYLSHLLLSNHNYP